MKRLLCSLALMLTAGSVVAQSSVTYTLDEYAINAGGAMR